MRPFMISPESGAETPVYLASAVEAANITGQIFANKKPQAATTYDEAAAQRLWRISAELVKLPLAKERR